MQKTHPITLKPCRPWWSHLADSAFAAMFLLGAFPETFLGEFYLGPVPLLFVTYYLGLAGMTLEVILSHRSLEKSVRVGLLVGILLLVLGVARGGELKWIVIDSSAFIGMIAGVYWIQNRSLEEVCWQWRRVAFCVGVLVFLTIVGLLGGWIAPQRVSGRMYVYSLFRATAFLAMVLPFLWSARDRFSARRIPDWLVSVAFASGYFLIFWVAYVTATRSVLLGGIASLLLLFRRHGGRVLVVGGVVMLLMATGYDVGLFPQISFGALEDRLFQGSGLEEEGRYQEVLLLWDQMQGVDLFVGKGFGSRFHSSVIVEGSDLAINPHVAIFTFLQKGGVGLFLFLVVIPFVRLLVRILRGEGRGGNSLALGCCSGALMYLIQSSMSGGWDFHSLFLYGLFLFSSFLSFVRK